VPDADKDVLRAAMGARRRAVPPEAARAAAEQVAGRVIALPEWRGARRVALYAALPDELPTLPLAAAARADSLPILWPRLEEADLVFVVCAAAALVPGRFGVPSPPAVLASTPLGPDDLVVVPGVAFDDHGRRLGRGGGSYDRALGALGREARSVGIGYDFQRVERVPTAPHDVAVRVVVTESGVTRRSPR